MEELKGLKIGRRFYKVKHQYLPEDYGRVNLSKGIIRIDDPQPPFVVADATLHEVLHAVVGGAKTTGTTDRGEGSDSLGTRLGGGISR